MLYILSYGRACVCRRREALTRKSESVSSCLHVIVLASMERAENRVICEISMLMRMRSLV